MATVQSITLARAQQIEATLATKITNPAGTANIADGAITSAKIADGAVTTNDIADLAVTDVKLASNSVTSSKIATSAVGNTALASNAVTTAKIADSSITSAKIVDGTIVNDDISASAAIDYSKVTKQPLSNISNVSIDTPSLADKQVLSYEASSQLWKNKQATGGVTVGDVKPSSPNPGDAWFDSNDGTLYVWYVETSGATQTSQWVQVQANSALEGTILARLSALEGQAIAFGTMSPNFLINAGFDIWQRGSSSTTNNAYIADRWLHSRSAGTHTVSRSTDVPTSQGFQYSLSFVSTNGTNPTITQRIESANSIDFAGQSVTISVWAKSTVGTAGLSWSTAYPNAVDDWTTQTSDKTGVFTATMTLGTWTRYSATFIANSLATQGYSISIFRSVTSASTTTLLTGIQLEVGTIATSFRRNANTIQAELAACQRYYYRITSGGTANILGVGRADATTSALVPITFPVTMRTTPSNAYEASGSFSLVSSASATVTSFGTPSASFFGPSQGVVYPVVSGGFTVGAFAQLYALNASSYIGFSAEL